MKCGDFKRLIHEQLDAREAASAEVERDWESHRSECPECRAEAQRYQALRRAIGAWVTVPAPSADFADRFLLQWEQSGAAVPATPGRGRRIWEYWPAALPIAAAAVLLLMVLPGVRRERPAKPAETPPSLTDDIDPDAFSDALAEATSATWELARATSVSAPRVGLAVFEAGELPESTASLRPASPQNAGPASDVLPDAHLDDDDARPLSGSARHAFGFLLGPDPPQPEALPSSSTGA
jgi:hypothetical protein